jgi:hypothetical protein
MSLISAIANSAIYYKLVGIYIFNRRGRDLPYNLSPKLKPSTVRLSSLILSLLTYSRLPRGGGGGPLTYTTDRLFLGGLVLARSVYGRE